jgi:DNA polymerase I-like protein with 3'-5' exonuclease and polymerase domains
LLVAIDIETKCALGCEEKCDHALDEHRNAITVIGASYRDGGELKSLAFRSLDAFRNFLRPQHSYCFHNGKFDLRTLTVKGIDIRHQWAEDTQLMAATLMEKVSPEYLEWYEAKRKITNSALPRGYSHRVGSPHSLKVLAPFFLGVDPFWEDPTNHDNDDYVKKDVEYTLRLAETLETKLKAEGSYEFYKTKLLPWTKMLLAAEQRGITLDLPLLDALDKEACATAADAKRKLDELWAPAYQEYFRGQVTELWKEYDEKLSAAIAKLKDPKKAEQTARDIWR